MCITFVTSFFHIYDVDYDATKTIEWRIERFHEIARTGIKICLYVSLEFVHLIPREYANVSIIEAPASFIDAETAELPQQRNIHKDIAKYMHVINSKTDFMSDAIRLNVWSSTHFAWIDFNISHVFRNKDQTLRYLRELDMYKLPDKCMLVPGCWNKYDNINIGHVTECINWRFCGGFFIGDKDSIIKFDSLYKTRFPEFIQTYNKLVWEVNFWAWLEVNSDWKPQWYAADHNDSILTNIPCSAIATVLKPDSDQTYYDYPAIPLFNPSSASYLYFNGEHLLNTRYVNYWYYENGSYMFYDGTNRIQNKNFFSRLTDTLIPVDYQEMKENETITLPRYNMYSTGIEDVRLYEHNGRVRFIATTVGYHTTGGNRMVIGNYDYKTLSYSDARLVESPVDAYCEKNWTPIPSSDGEERFIYKWDPIQIVTLAGAAAPRTPPACGDLEQETGGVRGTESLQDSQQETGGVRGTESPQVALADNHMIKTTIVTLAGGVRGAAAPAKGSSPFIEYNGELIGVTHFSEDAMPRRYFHMLVVLDRTTYEPIRYSKPFVFDKVGIEFCIGFDARDDKYRFWISQFDRDPVLFEVNTHIISFVNIYESEN